MLYGMAFIRIQDVGKSFETAAGKFFALRDVCLSIEGGEFVAIVGKSGSGKSTLLNLVAGIDRPTQGTVDVGTTAVHRLSENQLAAWRGKNVGVVFQFFQLMPTLTAIENVMLPMDFRGVWPPRERLDRARRLLADVALGDQAAKLPAELSGGEQQRVAIARALANDPPLIVADEPTGNLDSRTADAVFALFTDLVRHGKTIVFVTHDRDLASRASRLITLSDGRIVDDTGGAGRVPVGAGPPAAVPVPSAAAAARVDDGGGAP